MNEEPQFGSPHPVGVFDIAETDYRADPSLSCSEARKILEAPAKYRWARDAATEEHKDAFDFGKAAHTTILGVGAPVAVLDFADWRSKDARTARDDAYTDGLIPVLAHSWTTVEAMAAAVRAHPIASKLIDPKRGRAEQSMFWRDHITDRPLRARVDWLPSAGRSRLILVDLKTTVVPATPRVFGRSAASYGYAQQASWYLDGARTLIDPDAAFVFVVVEKDPPHLVNVLELDSEALAIGRDRNRRAITVWNDCLARNEWPGYPHEIASASLPRWAALEHDDLMADWAENEPQVVVSW